MKCFFAFHYHVEYIDNLVSHMQSKSEFRGHRWEKEKVALQSYKLPPKRGSIYMKFSRIGPEQCDLLIRVPAY